MNAKVIALVLVLALALAACTPDETSPEPAGSESPESPAASWESRDDSTPKLSPDGKRVVFVSERDGNADIYVINVDGSDERRLTDSPALDLDPAWSPDGDRIAFDSDPNGYPELYMMNADGSDSYPIEGAPPWAVFPAFAPDGERIAFSSGKLPGLDVFVLGLETGDLERLTNTPAATEWEVAWSPSGRLIAFATDERDDAFDLAAVDESGNNFRFLTSSRGREADPVFNTESQLIFDTTDPTGKPGLCFLDLPAKPREDPDFSCLLLIVGETPSVVPGVNLMVYASHVPGEGLRIFGLGNGEQEVHRIT